MGAHTFSNSSDHNRSDCGIADDHERGREDKKKR
jgi:hypothetical protein